ncbi:CinA family protein [Synergistaceae bacterium OttesenSCG-928-I11]|nr:CinA family protein [Synergistaceae bacterium OttesenSCG-928-I11]
MYERNKRSEIDDLSRKILDISLACHGEPSRKLFTFAESCTGGLVASAITGVPGASAVFSGSFVAYSNLAKIELLNVTPETIERHGAVSGECAAEMAWGALRKFDTRIAVSVTGIAGPDGGSEQKPVGTVWFAACHCDGRMRLKRGFYPNKNRRAVQLNATHAALRMLILALSEL